MWPAGCPGCSLWGWEWGFSSITAPTQRSRRDTRGLCWASWGWGAALGIHEEKPTTSKGGRRGKFNPEMVANSLQPCSAQTQDFSPPDLATVRRGRIP